MFAIGDTLYVGQKVGVLNGFHASLPLRSSPGCANPPNPSRASKAFRKGLVVNDAINMREEGAVQVLYGPPIFQPSGTRFLAAVGQLQLEVGNKPRLQNDTAWKPAPNRLGFSLGSLGNGGWEALEGGRSSCSTANVRDAWGRRCCCQEQAGNLNQFNERTTRTRPQSVGSGGFRAECPSRSSRL